MSSTTYPTPDEPTLSTTTAPGTNTEAVLQLGRRLATHLEAHDIAGHWMATHLAQLITAAESEQVTLEQRITIVDLDSGQPAGSLTPGREPDGMAYSPLAVSPPKP